MIFLVIAKTSQVPQAATMHAITGASRAGTMILEMMPSQLRPERPRAAIPEPMRPPNRAWEELDGRPNSQVKRFQRMPPMRPAKMINSAVVALNPAISSPLLSPLVCWIFRTSLVMVAATSTERNAPTRFRIADSPTATFGLSAPVAIEVAMALPVSWKPLVKSNPSAVMTSSTRISISPLMGTIMLARRSIFLNFGAPKSQMNQSVTSPFSSP